MAKMTDIQEKAAIRSYANRKSTIRQLAIKYAVSYEVMRRVMVKAVYSNGLKVRY